MSNAQPEPMRFIPPPESEYVAPHGQRKDDPQKATWPDRLARWTEHYEVGEGYLEAVSEAWSTVVRCRYRKFGVQLAGQQVGWTTGRLLLALRRERQWPRRTNETKWTWAEAHIQRYLAGQESEA